jgi:hypothetical protein
MTSWPTLAGPSLPETGASTNATPRASAKPARQAVQSRPTVPICTQTVPGPAARKPSGPVAASWVAGPSVSIVMTTVAPRTASAGLAATTAPSVASASVAGWRATYEQAAYAVAAEIDAVPAFWSGPRRHADPAIPPHRPPTSVAEMPLPTLRAGEYAGR